MIGLSYNKRRLKSILLFLILKSMKKSRRFYVNSNTVIVELNKHITRILFTKSANVYCMAQDLKKHFITIFFCRPAKGHDLNSTSLQTLVCIPIRSSCNWSILSLIVVLLILSVHLRFKDIKENISQYAWGILTTVWVVKIRMIYRNYIIIHYLSQQC